jgi:hypothetical protein
MCLALNYHPALSPLPAAPSPAEGGAQPSVQIDGTLYLLATYASLLVVMTGYIGAVGTGPSRVARRVLRDRIRDAATYLNDCLGFVFGIKYNLTGSTVCVGYTPGYFSGENNFPVAHTVVPAADSIVYLGAVMALHRLVPRVRTAHSRTETYSKSRVASDANHQGIPVEQYRLQSTSVNFFELRW